VSVTVALDELARRVEEFGSTAFLVTTSADARAHVVSVAVRFDDARFWLRAGRTSRSNLEAGGAATLLWPGPGGPYALIVDGVGDIQDDGEAVSITPTRAVLHRLADASEDLPGCIAIE
jgi:hypothetical protein